jgi:hypothetical protein
MAQAGSPDSYSFSRWTLLSFCAQQSRSGVQMSEVSQRLGRLSQARLEQPPCCLQQQRHSDNSPPP